MKSDKELRIRKQNGCIQTIPLYTDKKDIASSPKLALRVDGVKLYAELVDPDDDHASSLRCKNRVHPLAAKKREAKSEKDKLYLTDKRHVLIYEEKKYQAALERVDNLEQDYNSLLDGEIREETKKRLDAARELAASMRFENTYYHQDLEEIPNDLDISALDDTSYMYSGCKDLKTLQPFDLSKSKDMQSMFDGCDSLPSVFPYTVDLSAISDVSKLRNMFRASSVRKVYCTKAQEAVGKSLQDARKQIGADIIIGTLLRQDKYRMMDLYTSSYATQTSFPEQFCCLGMMSLRGMYENCVNMTTVEEIDTGWITDFREMFKGCLALPTEFPFVIDISSVHDPSMLQDMFKDSSVSSVEFVVYSPEFIEQITPAILGKPGIQIRTSLNVTNQKHTMKDLLPDKYQTMKKPYAHLNIESNFTDATEMFKGCGKIKEIEDESLSAAEGIKKARAMFQGCRSLVKAPYVDLSKVRDLTDLFYGCESLQDVRGIPTKKAKTFENMFYGCKSLPKTLPWMIDARTVGYANAFSHMLLGTPVEELRIANLDKDVRNDIKLPDIGENLKTVSYYASVDWLYSDSLDRYEEDFDKIVLWDDNKLSKLANIDEVNELRFENLAIIDDCIGRATRLRIIRSITGTENVKSMRGLFAGCHHLVSLPVIDIQSIATAEALENLVSETNLTEVHFKNASEAVKKSLTPEVLGKTKLNIVFD